MTKGGNVQNRPMTPLPTWQILSVFLIQLAEAMNGEHFINARVCLGPSIGAVYYMI